MLGTDGAWFHGSHTLRYHPMLLSRVWREFLNNRLPGYRPLQMYWYCTRGRTVLEARASWDGARRLRVAMPY
eukprot:4536677-Prymnesium_polylepis.1